MNIINNHSASRLCRFHSMMRFSCSHAFDLYKNTSIFSFDKPLVKPTIPKYVKGNISLKSYQRGFQIFINDHKSCNSLLQRTTKIKIASSKQYISNKHKIPWNIIN